MEEYYISSFIKEDFSDLGIYFPLFTDFRGRMYYLSIIGPTGSKLLRLAYYYGFYEEHDFKIQNNKYSLPFKDLLNSFCVSNNINTDMKYLETIFWCLIGIGKFFVNKDEYPVDTETFITNGIKFYNYQLKSKNLSDPDLHKELEIMHYVRILQSLKKSKIKKRALVKDATASINQILMKKLGPLEQNSLDYVNLGQENRWYDTYLIYRDKFFELHENEIDLKKKEFNLYFSRKFIKSTIMTIPYSAGFDLC